MSYYLGMDAGGSKTIAIIANDDGKVLGVGYGGIGNHQIDVERTRRSLQEAVSQALQQAGLKEDQIDQAWFGLAGADRPLDFEVLRPMVQGLRLPRWSISCDTTIALRAGTSKPYGVVLICGTGVNCSGLNAKGKEFQCGGFGYDFGDFGGGQDLGVEVFRTVVRAWEGREGPTLLTELLLGQLGYPSVDKMVGEFLDHGLTIPAEAAKLLFVAYEQGDSAAKQILVKQGVELGLAAAATIDRLGMTEEDFDLVLAGSILTRGDVRHVIRDQIERIVRIKAPGCKVSKLSVEPIVGAVVLAMEKSGRQVSPEVQAKISRQELTFTSESIS